jgi:hypothetical protein
MKLLSLFISWNLLFGVNAVADIRQFLSPNKCRERISHWLIGRHITRMQNQSLHYVNLPYLRPELGGNGVHVATNRFVVLNRESSKEYDLLFTEGLISCAAIIIRDSRSQTTLLSHFLTQSSSYEVGGGVQDYVNQLIGHFEAAGGRVQESDVTIVWGRELRYRYISRVNDLVDRLSDYHPRSLRMDSTDDGQITSSSLAVFIDLETGLLYKRDNLGGTPGEIDTSLFDRSPYRQRDNPRPR